MESLPLQLKMVLVFLGLGFVLDITSFASPEWNDLKTETLGLWRACTPTECVSIDDTPILSGAMQFGRVFQVFGLLGYIALTVQMCLFVFWKRDIRLLTGSVITAFITLFSLFFGAIMWGSGSNTSLSWGYYLCHLSALAVSAAGGILIYVRRQEVMQTIAKETDNSQNVV